MKMDQYFSISQAAKIADMTTETLRHYDRIDLVKPSKTDEWTGYRYYSKQEIVRLNTIRALRMMDFTLSEIKELLAYKDFNKIVSALKHAEQNADSKIAALLDAKAKIQRARQFYEEKRTDETPHKRVYVKTYPQRAIMLSQITDQPTLDNLWHYHRHFYDQIADNQKCEFSFEDLAGIYEQNGQSQLFAVCTRYIETQNLKLLPQGRYLCADCTNDNRDEVLKSLRSTAEHQYGKAPSFTLQLVILTSVLQWNYQAQVYID